MVAFLKFLLFLLIAIILLVVFIGYAVTKQFRKVYRRFQQTEENENPRVNGNVIYDQRSPEERSQKKIIPDDEGEYVEYEEVN